MAEFPIAPGVHLSEINLNEDVATRTNMPSINISMGNDFYKRHVGKLPLEFANYFMIFKTNDWDWLPLDALEADLERSLRTAIIFHKKPPVVDTFQQLQSGRIMNMYLGNASILGLHPSMLEYVLLNAMKDAYKRGLGKFLQDPVKLSGTRYSLNLTFN